MTRRTAHITPRYVFDRLRVIWHERRHPEDPWLPKQAVDLLDQLLRPTDVVVEFGAGRSTLWLAKRVVHLTSIESNQDWAKRTSDKLEALARPGSQSVVFAETVEDTVAPIMGMPDASVDVVLVDGAHRDHCAHAALAKLKPGGVLVIDNVNRYLPHATSRSPATQREAAASELWDRVANDIAAWRHIYVSNGVTDTGFWIKTTTADTGGA
ncbi:MAG: class I SAM-dependent methyltransferase [Pseudomonadota bacterium]